MSRKKLYLLYNDLIFSGKGLYDIINDDNIYTNQGIIFKETFNWNQNHELCPGLNMTLIKTFTLLITKSNLLSYLTTVDS